MSYITCSAQIGKQDEIPSQTPSCCRTTRNGRLALEPQRSFLLYLPATGFTRSDQTPPGHLPKQRQWHVETMRKYGKQTKKGVSHT